MGVRFHTLWRIESTAHLSAAELKVLRWMTPAGWERRLSHFNIVWHILRIAGHEMLLLFYEIWCEADYSIY